MQLLFKLDTHRIVGLHELTPERKATKNRFDQIIQ